MPSKSSRNSLPFEPQQKKNKKSQKSPPKSSNTAKTTKNVQKNRKNSDASLSVIPEQVSQRMIKRMAIFSGIPTALGMSSFFVFYWIVSHEWLDIPTSAVGAVSLGLFGLGVLGLSYGIFSSSWDENRVGSWWGWEEFTQNFGRMMNAWGKAKQDSKKN